MASLRRILKYTPAVVLGLLVVVWAVSLIVRFGSVKRLFGYQFGWAVGYGTISGGIQAIDPTFPEGWVYYPSLPLTSIGQVAGILQVYTSLPNDSGWCYSANIPIPMLVTVIAPLAIGPLLSFRFRLWHYLAYTVLVAVEFAYYLQWQD